MFAPPELGIFAMLTFQTYKEVQFLELLMIIIWHSVVPHPFVYTIFLKLPLFNMIFIWYNVQYFDFPDSGNFIKTKVILWNLMYKVVWNGILIWQQFICAKKCCCQHKLQTIKQFDQVVAIDIAVSSWHCHLVMTQASRVSNLSQGSMTGSGWPTTTTL